MRPLKEASMSLRMKMVLALAVGTLALGGITGRAEADPAVKLRVGIPEAGAFSFVPLSIGTELGIFAKHGIDLEIADFDGSTALEAALTQGVVEVALGSGTEFAFIPQGAPDTAVAALAERPSLLVVTVRPDTSINAVDDLKGRSIGVDASDPVPAWLVSTLSESKGWGPDGISALPLDDPLVTDSKINLKVEGIVADLLTAIGLEQHGNGRTIVNFGDVVKDFPFYVIFARNDLIEQKPDSVKNFLAAWFETVKWMTEHKSDAVKQAAAQLHASEETTVRLYEQLMPAFSPNGKFNDKALATLAKALVAMKVLDREQDLRRYVTEKLLDTSCQAK